MQLKLTTFARLCYLKSFVLSFIEIFLFQIFTSSRVIINEDISAQDMLKGTLMQS